MTNSDWILVVTTLFLGVIAIFSGPLSEIIKRNLLGPKLKITFEEIPPYCVKTSYVYRSNPPEDVFGKAPVFFFRFLVENFGKSKLDNCEAVLEQLWIYDSAGKPKKLKNFQGVNLLWVNPHETIIDIRPNRKNFCNIGHIPSKEYQIWQETKVFHNLSEEDRQSLRFVLNFFFSVFSTKFSCPWNICN